MPKLTTTAVSITKSAVIAPDSSRQSRLRVLKTILHYLLLHPKLSDLQTIKTPINRYIQRDFVGNVTLGREGLIARDQFCTQTRSGIKCGLNARCNRHQIRQNQCRNCKTQSDNRSCQNNPVDGDCTGIRLEKFYDYVLHNSTLTSKYKGLTAQPNTEQYQIYEINMFKICQTLSHPSF